MTQNVEIICHLGAGQGKGKTVLKHVCQYLDRKSVAYRVHPSQDKQQIYQLVQSLLDTYQTKSFPLLIIGGDGSLHHVVEALYLEGVQIPVTYIPAGTGNDFARAWLKNTSYQTTLDKMIEGKAIQAIPIFSYENLSQAKKGIIINSLGLGLDALTNKKKTDLPKLVHPLFAKLVTKLKLSYLIGLFLSLGSIPKFPLRLVIDHKELHLDQVSIATIVNNPYMGGGILIDNLSHAAKDELAMIVYHHVGLKDVLDLIARVLLFKNQDQSNCVSRFVGQKIEIHMNQAIQGQVDGEPFIDSETHLSISKGSYPFIL